jgi:hypothetical protein
MFLFLYLGDMFQILKTNWTTLGKTITNPLYFQNLYHSNKKVDEAEILCENSLNILTLVQILCESIVAVNRS